MAKLKLNFASKVTVGTTAKSDSSNMYSNERARLQAEINSHPINIDRSIFSKTDHEKAELKTEKAHWKRMNYGSK
jgi:hypothetical protein